MVASINKVPIVHSDIAIGSGLISQQRGSVITSEQKIELNWIFRTTTEIRDLDFTMYSRVSLHQAGALKEYWFNTASAESDDDDTVLVPTASPTLGRWILVVESSGFLLKAGDSMTGDLVWLNATSTQTRLETIAEADNVGNGLRFYDTAGGPQAFVAVSSSGQNALISFISETQGNFGFSEAKQSAGQYRFIIQADGGATRKMVLGTPWDNSIPGTPTGKLGTDHLQLLFERETEQSTPFFQASSDGKLQVLLEGDGGALFTDAIEVRNFQAIDNFTYVFYTNSDASSFGVDGIGIFEPAKTIEEGATTWYSGDLWIRTNNTSGSNLGIHTSKFLEDGSLELEGGLFIKDFDDNISNGYHFYTNGFFDGGIGADSNQMTITPQSSTVASEVIIETHGIGGSPTHQFRFQSDGDLNIPGTVTMSVLELPGVASVGSAITALELLLTTMQADIVVLQATVIDLQAQLDDHIPGP